MGRIDEALRRSAGKSPLPPPVHSVAPPSEDVFVSAWTFGGLPEPKAPEPAAEIDESPVRPHPPSPPPLHVVWPSLLARFKPEWRERLALTDDAEPGLAEQFRRLAATLLHSQRGENIRSVMITSAVPADGKTLTALNLALILSESYKRRVLLIDGDLRRPTISDATNLIDVEGLSEVISAADERRVPLVQLSETLTLLPAGRPEPDPLSGITSSRMQQLLKEAVERFDWVILDTPPVGIAADASLLCPMVDGTLLVVRAGQTPFRAIERALETIGRDRLLGVILNGVQDQEQADYDGGYYYYQPETDEGSSRS